MLNWHIPNMEYYIAIKNDSVSILTEKWTLYKSNNFKVSLFWKCIISFFFFLTWLASTNTECYKPWHYNSCSLRLTVGLILNKNESNKGFNYKTQFFFKFLPNRLWSEWLLTLENITPCEFNSCDWWPSLAYPFL